MIDLKSKPFYLNDEDIVWVEQTLNAMSLEEKVGHLFCPIGLSSEPSDLKALLDEFNPAGIMFRPGEAEESMGVHKYLQQNSKVPMLIAANLESGGNGAVKEGTEFGSQMQVGATGDPAMAGKLGQVVAEETRLACADDDQLEEVPPAAVGSQVAVVCEGHDLLHVRPLGVRDQHHAFAGLKLVEQGLRRLRVENEVRLRVGHDVGLQRALDVGHVEACADMTVEILVTVDLG